LAGDLFAIWWKPNIRNLNLLRARATVAATDLQQGRVSDWLFVGGVVAFLLTLLFGSIILVATVIWFISTRLTFM
jgi:Flp pilus assembly protein protease CpaA